jgi:hypothetical protein
LRKRKFVKGVKWGMELFKIDCRDALQKDLKKEGRTLDSWGQTGSRWPCQRQRRIEAGKREGRIGDSSGYGSAGAREIVA